MWIAVSCSVKLFPNLEAALKGVFNRVLKNLRKASTISIWRGIKNASFSFAIFQTRAMPPPSGCRRAHRLRRTRTLSVTQANMARKHAQQLWCGLCSRALPSRCVRLSSKDLVGRLCHARQRPSLCVVKSAVRTLIPTFDASPHARTWRRLVPPQKTAPELCRTRFVRSQVVQT